MKLLARLISTGLGIGYFPIAPGTMGALAILILYWIMPPISTLELLIIIFVLTIVGIYSATLTEEEVKQKLGSEKGVDPKIVIIDEIIGMLITLVAIPKTTKYVIAAFLLFRVFDIVKPYPIRKIEKLPTGWGIVFDDVMAGIYANLLLQLGKAFF